MSFVLEHVVQGCHYRGHDRLLDGNGNGHDGNGHDRGNVTLHSLPRFVSKLGNKMPLVAVIFPLVAVITASLIEVVTVMAVLTVIVT